MVRRNTILSLKTLPFFSVALLPLAAGYHGALWGNLLVLGVTVGIFFATLNLGRHTATSSASQSTSR